MKSTAINKKKSKKKVILVGLGLLAASLVSFFGIQYWKRNKNQTGDSSAKAGAGASPVKQSKPSAKKKTKTASETKTNPQPGTTVKPKQTVNGPVLAKSIHASLVKRNFANALALLQDIKSVSDYSLVNTEFKKLFLQGVRQTLVNGFFSTFNSTEQKSQIKQVFVKIGLKFDGKKWSLLGLDRYIITSTPTTVWKDPKTSVKVPERMVLGKEIDHRGQHTVFENEGQFFLVETRAVQYYRN